MNTASLELCKELYELSGWQEKTDWTWRLHIPNRQSILLLTDEKRADEERYRHQPRDIADRFAKENAFYPAYDLGYLLRKLPKFYAVFSGELYWYIAEIDGERWKDTGTFANTPEDAAAKLAVELLKSGVLPSEHKAEAKASSGKDKP